VGHSRCPNTVCQYPQCWCFGAPRQNQQSHYTNSGWQCPGCGSYHAPTCMTCPNHIPAAVVTREQTMDPRIAWILGEADKLYAIYRGELTTAEEFSAADEKLNSWCRAFWPELQSYIFTLISGATVAVEGWRPIDDLAKNGRAWLLGWEHAPYATCRGRYRDGGWDVCGNLLVDPPTHYTELPIPPIASGLLSATSPSSTAPREKEV